MKTKVVSEDGEVLSPAPFTVPNIGIFFKTPYNHDTDEEAVRTATVFLDKSRTQQQFADEADINKILAKFLQTGELYGGTQQMSYQVIDEGGDLQDRIVTSHQVDAAWNALPSSVRNILKNPQTFTDYVQHCVATGDISPLQELGLVKPTDTPVETKTPAPASPEVPASTAAPAAVKEA